MIPMTLGAVADLTGGRLHGCTVAEADALLVDGPEPDRKPTKPARTHWDMLLERRSVEELEELLDERLTLLRESRGEKPKRKRAAASK